MTDETRRRVLAALEGDYGRATDNAHRARAAKRGPHSAADAALYREYEREETDALAALMEFDPAWKPLRAFGGGR